MFWFGWSGANSAVHWIVPVIGSGIFGAGIFLLFQASFGYLGESYYPVLGAVFSGNALMRASFGGAFPVSYGP
jgi:DHA1 family multidrug resistance protein-like MFS transporter